MESEDCDYSDLVADPKGHPRSKIYAPMGWIDYAPQNTWFNLTTPMALVKHIPIAIPAFPALSLRTFTTELQRIKCLNQLKQQHFITKIFQPYQHSNYSIETIRKLLKFQLNIAPSQMDGFLMENLHVWEYYRLHPVYQGLYPTYVALYLNDQLIGMGSFARQWFYVSKFGIHVPIGFPRDVIIDNNIGLTKDQLNDCYQALLLEMVHAAGQRDCMALLFNTTPTYKHLIRGLKASGFIDTGANGTFMIRPMRENQQLPPKSIKPLFISAGENFGSL
jgi:hypothetical protein